MTTEQNGIKLSLEGPGIRRCAGRQVLDPRGVGGLGLEQGTPRGCCSRRCAPRQGSNLTQEVSAKRASRRPPQNGWAFRGTEMKPREFSASRHTGIWNGDAVLIGVTARRLARRAGRAKPMGCVLGSRWRDRTPRARWSRCRRSPHPTWPRPTWRRRSWPPPGARP